MNNPKLQHILDKLRKLMDLKESATMVGELGEANAAAAGISRLLKEYDLTLQDIPDERKITEPVEMEDIPFHFSYMREKWYWSLLDVVAKYNGTQTFRERSLYPDGKVRDITYKLVGRKKNREVSLYLISYLAENFIRIGRREYPSWKLQYIKSTGCTPPSLTVYMKSFLAGCVCGLDEKFRTEQDDLPHDGMTALAVTFKTEIDNFLQGMEIGVSKNRPMKAIESAVMQGEHVGRNINIHKGIGQKKSRAEAVIADK